MNNLKRVLSLGLSGAMLAGMVTIGASAANTDFTDSDEITHTEAVDVMSTLGVLKGNDDGTYAPDRVVTRAEMAKIITVMLNGGKDPTLGTAAAGTFSDTTGHWAESYIEYCASQGIIAGQGDGTFAPDASVTGAAAAKMLLVALGYDSDVFGFTGVDWEINVNRIANVEAKLYDEIENIDTSAGLSRDDTAQMAYNTLEAKLMKTTFDKVASSGEISYNYQQDTNTFLNKYFSAYTFVGTYVGNTETDGLTDGYIKVEGDLDTADTTVAAYEAKTATFPSDLDISNIGEEVKVIFKDGKGGTAGVPDKNDTIYGVFNTGNTVVYNVTKADLQDAESTTKIKFGGTKYTVAEDGVTVVTNYNTADEDVATVSAEDFNKAYSKGGEWRVQSLDTIKFVCNDSGEIYRAYVTEYTVARVTGITSTKITLSGVGTLTIEDHNIADGLAKDDVVVYTRFYDDSDKDEAYFTVAKAESTDGELTGFKEGSNDGEYTNVVLDGTTYKVHNYTLADVLDDVLADPDENDIGDTVRVYTYGGLAVALESVDSTGGNYAVITDADTSGKTLTSNLNPFRVTILAADGSETTYDVHKESTYNGTNDLTSTYLAAGNLVEYSISGGKLRIKNVTVPGTVSSNTSYVWNKTTKQFTYRNTDSGVGASVVAASGAVLFTQVTVSGKTSYYVYNMRDLGNVGTTSSSNDKTAGILDKNGLVKVGYVELTSKPGSITSATLYGVVSSYVGQRTLDDETYYQYTIATTDGQTVTVNLTSKGLSAGNLVTFDEAADTKYEASSFTNLLDASTAAGKETWTIAAVKSYSSSILTYWTGTGRDSETDAFSGYGVSADTLTVASDVVIGYIDGDDYTTGDDIGVNAFDVSTGYANIVFHTDDDGNVDYILVETSGERNLDSNEFGLTGGFALGSAPTVTASVGTKGAYTSEVPTRAQDGRSFTVKVKCESIDSNNTTLGETVTVTYNSVPKTITFTSAEVGTTKTVTFEGASGQTAVTMDADATTE